MATILIKFESMNGTDFYLIRDFGKLLKKNHNENRHLLGKETDCMRVYDRNLEKIPLTVDLYGTCVKVSSYGFIPETLKNQCLDCCASNLYTERENVFFSERRKKGTEQHEKTELTPVVIKCMENGLVYEVNLTSYVDTGLFLDQVFSRRFVREHSSGKAVLNLFSYTGSFSVNAAAGGADSVTSVDMSATYTAWAERNLKENGFTGNSFPCVCEDAHSFVERAAEEGKKYSLVIFDPPVFSNSHRMKHDFDVSRDWKSWIEKLRRILTKDGIILFSTNLSSFRMDYTLKDFRVTDVTMLFKAPGFKSGLPGSVRTWILSDISGFGTQTEEKPVHRSGRLSADTFRSGSRKYPGREKPYGYEFRSAGRTDRKDRKDRQKRKNIDL